jgi:hypothetical protein
MRKVILKNGDSYSTDDGYYISVIKDNVKIGLPRVSVLDSYNEFCVNMSDVEAIRTSPKMKLP